MEPAAEIAAAMVPDSAKPPWPDGSCSPRDRTIVEANHTQVIFTFLVWSAMLDVLQGSGQKGENVDIFATYTDASGAFRMLTIKSSDLSDSWAWVNPIAKGYDWASDNKMLDRSSDSSKKSVDDYGLTEGAVEYRPTTSVNPVKFLRRKMRLKRRESRTNELIQSNMSTYPMDAASIEHSNKLETTARVRYRKEYDSHTDSLLKLMRDQIIMAKAYASILQSKSDINLYDSLVKCIKDNQNAIGDANSDTELHPSALEYAKTMGHFIAVAKGRLIDCSLLAKKIRAMLQLTDDSITILKKQSNFLIQHAAKTVPKSLHCLSLHLTADYYYLNHSKEKETVDQRKLVDPTLYHYAIFSDNVLATSIVVNSTSLSAREPEKHVFHIVTDNLNIAAMRMWFLVNSPDNVTTEVENIDDFKWLNSSYCSVLRQLESASLKEYYFKTQHPSTLSAGSDSLKYRNPKYLSMLNHLRFYLPEVYPHLDKILFLDDDIVVQKDLTPLWSISLDGMVNGAVETCKESFHRFDKYLNFSNPKISENFDPNACGWAFGMNMFDLKEWRKRNITGIYHYWQDLNEDRTLWKLGSLPPGLITFYNLTYPFDRGWHALGLGYDPALNQTEIENAAVIHYNGNYKPWLEIAFAKYKAYWAKYLRPDNPYLHNCKICGQ